THALRPGQQIFCYIPESGRFMTAYMLFEAEAVDAPQPLSPSKAGDGTTGARAATPVSVSAHSEDADTIAPPHDPDQAPQGLGPLLTELASIWHDYRSRVWRTPVVRRL